MIKLTYKELNSEGFNKALTSLGAQSGFSNFDSSYNIAKIIKHVQSELLLARQTYIKWTEGYLVKDEKGAFVVAKLPRALTPFEIKEGMEEEFSKKMDEFLKTEVVLSAKPLLPTDLGSVNLAPQEVINLEPIFDPASFSQQAPSAH